MLICVGADPYGMDRYILVSVTSEKSDLLVEVGRLGGQSPGPCPQGTRMTYLEFLSAFYSLQHLRCSQDLEGKESWEDPKEWGCLPILGFHLSPASLLGLLLWLMGAPALQGDL